MRKKISVVCVERKNSGLRILQPDEWELMVGAVVRSRSQECTRRLLMQFLLADTSDCERIKGLPSYKRMDALVGATFLKQPDTDAGY